MKVLPTGHAEIDRQHTILHEIVQHTALPCKINDPGGEVSCQECLVQHHDQCTDKLAHVVGRLLAFMAGHSVYEEKLMDLLPDIPDCRAHRTGHLAAHSDISLRLSALASRIGAENAAHLLAELQKILGGWLGKHESEYDVPLARHLETAEQSEIAFDGELVVMLDEYVFHNRPTEALRPGVPRQSLDDAQLEVLSMRYESLTPKQREVCRLVVEGLMNKEIVRRLGATINTIKTHRAEVFRRMQATSMLDLVRKIDLLRTAGRDAALPLRGRGVTSEKPQAAVPQRMRVMILTRSRALCQLLGAGLAALGYEVCDTGSGWAPSHTPAAESFDVCILDADLQDERGSAYDIASRLREATRCTLVLLGADRQSLAPDLARLADAWLDNPVDFGCLTEVMRSTRLKACSSRVAADQVAEKARTPGSSRYPFRRF